MKGQAPTRNFFHDGTKYIITGNEEMAESHFHEVRAFLHNTKRTNVNNLPIITTSKEFDDGTIANLSLVHGIEIINIFAPSFVSGGEVVEKVKTVDIEMIVPVMRSTDNKYWIACMSGTFEPPYYAFENIYDLPAEAFDDNAETDIDEQLISRGHEEYDGSIDDPELYFIAQTAIRPNDYDYHDSGGYDSNTTTDTSVNNVSSCAQEPNPYYSGRTHDLCLPEFEPHDYSIILYYFYGWVDSTTTLTGSAYTTTITVDGLPLGIPDSTETTTRPPYTTKAKLGSSISSFTGWYNEGIHIEPCDPQKYDDYLAQAPDGNIGDATTDMNGNIGSAAGNFGPYTVSTNINNVFYDLSSGARGVRIETAIPNNFASSYRETNAISSSTYTKEASDICAGVGGVSSSSYSSEIYKDWLQVNEKKVLVNTPGSDENPRAFCGENMLKYYNTDSIASLTAIACVNLFGGGTTVEYKYYYIGPNSDNEFALTALYEHNGEGDHIMANVLGIDDKVKFNGEIFLGLVKYEIKYK